MIIITKYGLVGLLCIELALVWSRVQTLMDLN